MSSIAHPSASFDAPLRPLAKQRARAAPSRPQTAAVSSASAPPRRGWLERLASWAEAQPPHRRLGSWTLMR